MSKADKPEEKVALDEIGWRKNYETGRVEVKTSDGWVTINQDEMDEGTRLWKRKCRGRKTLTDIGRS